MNLFRGILPSSFFLGKTSTKFFKLNEILSTGVGLVSVVDACMIDIWGILKVRAEDSTCSQVWNPEPRCC